MDSISSGECPDGFDPNDKAVGRQLKLLSRCAPVALRMASRLLDEAVRTGDDLDEGLSEELEGLEGIFGTEDALEGLSALIEGRKPEYVGK